MLRFRGRWFLTVLILSLLITMVVAAATASGHVQGVISYDPSLGELPEGVAVDKTGNIFVSLDPLGQLRKISPDGTETLYADFGSPGALGLATDAIGNVYVARNSGAADHGILQVSRDGSSEHLAGTESIIFPNSIAFDKRGNLYATDTILGAVWRVPPGGSAELWLQDELLEGLNLPTVPFPFPLGANGIAYRQGTLYVSNTEKALVLRIPILGSGGPGNIEVVASGDELFPLDGIALDVHGDIYAAVIAQSKLVKIDAVDGTITTLATAADGLDFPASVAFGTGMGARKSIFVTNFALGPPGGAGPGVVQVDVGQPGQPVP